MKGLYAKAISSPPCLFSLVKKSTSFFMGGYVGKGGGEGGD